MQKKSLVLLFALSAPSLYAIDTSIPTFFFRLGGGLTTYKSQLVESNNTSFTTGYGLGANAGNEHNLGSMLFIDSNTTAFTYAESTLKSTITSNFQDAAFVYHFFNFFYLGLIFNQSTFLVTKESLKIMDTVGLGTGFNGGMYLPINNKGNALFLDFRTVNTSTVRDALIGTAHTLTIGPRTDLFVGGMIRLTTSLLHLQLGLKQRTYSLSYDKKASSEALTTTWIGLEARGFF